MKVEIVEHDWKQLHCEKDEVISFLLDQVFEMSKNLISSPDECVETSNILEHLRSRLSKINTIIQKSSEVQNQIITEVALLTSENNKVKQRILELVKGKS